MACFTRADYNEVPKREELTRRCHVVSFSEYKTTRAIRERRSANCGTHTSRPGTDGFQTSNPVMSQGTLNIPRVRIRGKQIRANLNPNEQTK